MSNHINTVDPIARATKFGRQAVAGTKIVKRMVYGLAREDQGPQDGTIHRITHRGSSPIYVLQVAHTDRQYLSREMLDDFDVSAEPGWSFQWDGIEVEPTAEERAEDKKISTQEASRASRKAAEKAENIARAKAIDAADKALDDVGLSRTITGIVFSFSSRTVTVRRTCTRVDRGAIPAVVAVRGEGFETFEIKVVVE